MGPPGTPGPVEVIPKDMPLPDNGPPWEAAVDSNLIAQPQGRAQGRVHRERPSPTPNTGKAGKGPGRGCREVYLSRAMKPQTNLCTSLTASSHPEYETIKCSCLHGSFSVFLVNCSLLSSNRHTESSYMPFIQLLLTSTSSITIAHGCRSEKINTRVTTNEATDCTPLSQFPH